MADRQFTRRTVTKGAAWAVPAVAVAGTAPANAVTEQPTGCGLSIVRTDGLTDPETFSEISSGNISGGATKTGVKGTVWVDSALAQCGCGIKDLALHYSVPCPNSTDGAVDCANPQEHEVILTVNSTGTAYFANPFVEGCSNRMQQYTWTTDGGVGLGEPGNYYSRFLFQNQFEGDNCGYVRLTGEEGTTTLTAATSLNQADGQNCYGADLVFTVELDIVVSPTQPAGSTAVGTECSCA